MKYAYLLAGHAAPRLDLPPDLEPEAFLQEADVQMLKQDLEQVRLLLDGGGGEACTEVREYHDFESLLSNRIAARRDAGRGEAAGDSSVDRAVAEAWTAPDPLERERRLDAARWRAAEDLSIEDPWGLPGVLRAVLQLRLQAREHSFETEHGRAVLRDLLKTLDPGEGAA